MNSRIWNVISVSFMFWWQALARTFSPASGMSLWDRVVCFVGVFVAHPLSLISLLFDFRWFALNRLLNYFQARMQTPCILPTNEESWRDFVSDFLSMIKEEMGMQLAVAGVAPNPNTDSDDYEYEDWGDEADSYESEDSQESDDYEYEDWGPEEEKK